ncbi:sensor histidine kinase [Gynurincola endophyticus]|jgi:two-component system sensor histidine kinase CiaH|uniref:sensor histidine kinase n=1 Tax=Gynurincola endophyticus TaxID=2479004 RepID=UPI000F8DAAEF|nr:ATP-binding protein [Gynurincola endophyticus]
MSLEERKKLMKIGVMYWFLLIYIISALGFWYYSLERQNVQMKNYRLNELKLDDPAYMEKADRVEDDRRRKSAQFLGEGLTFLAFILVGAVFVYKAIRKQITLQAQQQNFMMAITHELKTPIAVAKLNLETLLKRQLPEEQKQKLLDNSLSEINRLNTLTNNILVSAQLESKRYSPTKDEIDFSNLVDTCVGGFETRFPEREWHVAIHQGINVTGDQLLLQILINNLLENAMKYSPKDSAVTCNLKKENNQAIVEVIDEGQGIPDTEKKKVFTKFYRIGNETTRTAKGTGLGLFLCHKIAKDHRGTIRIKDNSPRGTNFTITLPLA